MKLTGPIFRPPPEAYTPLLQVTVGCSHNKCSYCTMYRSTKFTTEKIDQIEEDIKEIRERYGSHVKRIFLLNGEAFVLSAEKLIAISDMLLKYLPKIETITTFASVRNIMTKTDDELQLLEKAKYNELYVGIETGHKETLAYFNKGYAMEDVYENVPRLTKAGISFHAAMMLGSGGKGKGVEVATDTAKLLNTIKPLSAGYTTLGLFEGSELMEDVKKGLFVPASEREVTEELMKVIELVDVDGIVIQNEHQLNAIRVKGTLPQDRDKMITYLQEALISTDDSFLDNVMERKSL